MSDKDIKTLLDRFFDGETTLAEERQLYGYFASSDISPELMPLRQMFLDLTAIHEGQSLPAPDKPVAERRPLWRRLKLAAAVIATAGILAGAYLAASSGSDYEMLVYGKRVTSQEAVMGEVRHTMEASCESAPDIDAQLKDVFKQ